MASPRLVPKSLYQNIYNFSLEGIAEHYLIIFHHVTILQCSSLDFSTISELVSARDRQHLPRCPGWSNLGPIGRGAHGGARRPGYHWRRVKLYSFAGRRGYIWFFARDLVCPTRPIGAGLTYPSAGWWVGHRTPASYHPLFYFINIYIYSIIYAYNNVGVKPTKKNKKK